MEIWWDFRHLLSSFPHIVCIMEHHLNQYEMVQFHIDNCTLGANYCRHSLKKGGGCIFVHNSLNFVGTDLEKYSHDQDIEACTIILFHNSYIICILTIYRAPTGNFICFIKTIRDNTVLTVYFKYSIYHMWWYQCKLPCSYQ